MKQYFRTLAAGAGVLLLGVAGSSAQTLSLKYVHVDAASKVGYYTPKKVSLTPKKPDAVKKEPVGLKEPRYGVINVGKQTFALITTADQIYFDSNGNGDLTDDPTPTWKGQDYDPGDGGKLVLRQGSATAQIHGLPKGPAVIGLYGFDRRDPRPQVNNAVMYYADFAFEGEASLGDKKFHVMIVDQAVTGGALAKGDDKTPNPQLLIDANNNGKFDQVGESYDAGKPFNIGGTTYELRLKGNNWEKAKLVKSDQTVAEISPPPDLRPGHKAVAFVSKTTDGKSVNFPSDYKGKIVLLDFWATWCGPCTAELPFVTAAYGKYHDKGLEILGVSLDDKSTITGMPKFMQEHGMTWTQVADAKGWDAEVGHVYGIFSIPHAYLVDGDTGEIIAEGDSIRGEAFDKAVHDALAKKGLIGK